MGWNTGGAVIESVQLLFDAGTNAGKSDADLLRQFVGGRADGADAAFASLVERHGVTVWRVCRALLSDPNDVEDAFQATFLVLVRKANRIRRPEAMGPWLYGTAHRAAHKLRRSASRRRTHEERAGVLARAGCTPGSDPVAHEFHRREQARMVHEELARLSAPSRAAILLCDLEGLSQDEAAGRLRCSDRTLRRRLATGRRRLQLRLARRGVAPASGLLATAVASESAPAAVLKPLWASTVQAGIRFARVPVGASPDATGATLLARGLLRSMTWTKLLGTTVAASLLLSAGLARGLGIGGDPAPVAPAPAGTQDPSTPRTEPKAVDSGASPADQYRDLVKRHDDAMKAVSQAAQKVYDEVKDPKLQQAKTTAIYEQGMPKPGEYAAKFVALANRYPNDPAAVDALIWVVEKTMQTTDWWGGDFTTSVEHAMAILARDHAGEPRLGPLCLKLVTYPSPLRVWFLRAISERSPNRVVKGQATLALAEYQRLMALHVEMLKNPDAPENAEKERQYMTAVFGTEAAGRAENRSRDIGNDLRKQRANYSEHAPDFLRLILAADPAALRREAEALHAKVLAEYGDLPFARLDQRPTKETLADVARRAERPGGRPGFGQIDEKFRVAENEANRASDAAGHGEAGVKAYMAKAPKWADFGPQMWEFAENDPHHPDAYEALLWILGHWHRFFDARDERAATLGRAVDRLIRDHLADISGHLAERNVAQAFGMGGIIPGPHLERLHHALFERAPDRETRGRMGLVLARQLRANAELGDSLATRGADPARRYELAIWPQAFIDGLRTADRAAIRDEAVKILDRVVSDYGDVRDLTGMVLQPETLAVVADRERNALRTLSIGQPAPEIEGGDIDGRPMKLSDFRGKVVLLDFGSHEHCGGCRLVYPRMKAVLQQYQGRPFVILGINNNDKREALKEAVARGEIAWRCWWDGDRLDGPGPITSRWNVSSYPTFMILDHRGVICYKDLHPEDTRGFGDGVEALVKDAETHQTP